MSKNNNACVTLRYVIPPLFDKLMANLAHHLIIDVIRLPIFYLL